MSIVVYRAREVVTLDPSCPRGEAVAVREGRILHVGSNAEVVDALRDQDFTVDTRYAEHVIVPGFIEAHGHLFSDGALGQLVWTGFDDRPRPDSSVALGCQTLEDVISRLRERARVSDAVVVGYGFDPVFHDGRALRREDLDRVSTTQGVVVVNASGHLAYANSEQMRRCNVTASSDVKGVIKDADGVPTGEFHETAMALVLDEHSVIAGDPERAVRDGGELLRQVGVTTASDMALFAAGDAFETYTRVANEAGFPVRVCYSPSLGDMARRFGADDLFSHLSALRQRSTARFQMGPLKLITDGSIQGYTGKLKWPGYCADDDHGFLILDEDAIVERMQPYHDAGFQFALHTNGDESTEVALRAIGRVLARSPRLDHRHRLEHCQMASRAMLRTMATLGVGANFFSNHIYYWGDIHRTRTMGPDKARRMNPARSALAARITISLHSDHPVTPVNPLFTMWCAVNRRTRSGHQLGVEECLTPLEALEAVTLGSAYLLHRDNELGSIEVGKYADFTVLSQNPLEVDPLMIKDIRVIDSVLEGEPVGPGPHEAR
ncbi:MAG: amidohydrolase [Acidimicrobiales bacterium]